MEMILMLSDTQIPAHLLPSACYVCGYPKGQHTDADGHSFWSNAQAREDFAREPQGTSSEYSPEAAYVAEHRPY